MSIVVLKSGLLSTIQDEGRWHYQHLGVSVSGVMDSNALRLANILVGNPPLTACIEMTLTGASLQFEHHACIAITGAFLNPYLDDMPLQQNRSYLVTSGQTLHFKPSASSTGARTYLAVHGGFRLPHVLGSQSTDIKSHLGGINGKPLQKGDKLHLNGRFSSKNILALKQKLRSQTIYLPSGLGIHARQSIRVLKGAHFSHFTKEAQDTFFQAPYTVSAQSDRMGYRLEGGALNLHHPLQIYSEPTAFGSIQVPPDGKPIILMADRQSTGGYPKIANVIQADLGAIAQTRTGQSLSFQVCSIEEAQALWAQRHQRFMQLQAQLHDTVQSLKHSFIVFEDHPK